MDWEAATREAVELLSRYLRIDTAHPRGRTREAAAFFAERLADEGFETHRYVTDDEEKVNLLARLRSPRPRGKPLLLGNHMDVVPAVGSEWTIDPFSGRVADGYVWGRGALDMKGMGVMELMAVLLLARLDVELERDVILLCTCDEEIRSDLGTKWMVDRHFDELDPAFVLNEGGSGLPDFLSAGVLFEVDVEEKRSLPVRMVARGPSGHGSQPWDGAATHRLVRAAHAVLFAEREERECAPVAELIRRLGGASARRRIAASRVMRPMLGDTIALTSLAGGYATNILPEQAEITFDCRLLPDTDPQVFLERLDELVDDPSIELQATFPGASRPAPGWETEMFTAIERACLAHVPDAVVAPSLGVGGTDAHFFRDLGVPAYGLFPCLLTVEELERVHGVDERISVDNLRLGTKIVFDLVLRLAAPLRASDAEGPDLV